jgi:hypothetical protein
VQCLPLPARSPNLNAYAERWVRSIKEECLSQLILFGEKSLQRAVSNYLANYHQERTHQGKDNLLLFPVAAREASGRDAIRCRERLGGLLKYYSRRAPHEYFYQTGIEAHARRHRERDLRCDRCPHPEDPLSRRSGPHCAENCSGITQQRPVVCSQNLIRTAFHLALTVNDGLWAWGLPRLKAWWTNPTLSRSNAVLPG